VAVTCGDGVDFDELSFDGADESEWWIEVKSLSHKVNIWGVPGVVMA
jgi:hypothetical protein